MEITRVGNIGFKIKGKKAIVLINPSLEIEKLTAHVVIALDKEKIPKLKGEPLIIFGPGEYEIRQVRILGLKEKGMRIYKIEIDGLFLLYFDKVKERLAEEKVEVLNQVDILFLPVARPKAAWSLVSQLEPAVVIPVEKNNLEEFLKEEGIEEGEKTNKFIIHKEDVPEERRIVILNSD